MRPFQELSPLRREELLPRRAEVRLYASPPAGLARQPPPRRRPGVPRPGQGGGGRSSPLLPAPDTVKSGLDVGLPEPLPTGACVDTRCPAPRLVSPGPHPQSQGGPHTDGKVRLRGSHTARCHQARPVRRLSCPSVSTGISPTLRNSPTPTPQQPQRPRD